MNLADTALTALRPVRTFTTTTRRNKRFDRALYHLDRVVCAAQEWLWDRL